MRPIRAVRSGPCESIVRISTNTADPSARKIGGNVQTLLKNLLFFGVVVTTVQAQNIGSPAPDFSAKTIVGKDIRLSGCSGNVVLIDFWASWCGPCREEMPFLTELYQKYRDKGFVVLAVNIDTDIKNTNRFLDQLKAKPEFDILIDKGSAIPPLYKLEGMPTTVFVDRKGVIRFRHKGFKMEQKILLEKELESLAGEK